MEYLTGIYLTDEKLQNGMQYKVKDLEHIVWLSKSGSPSSIAHDIHRTVGWTRVNEETRGQVLLMTEAIYSRNNV